MRGFTLLELLVVISIIAILTVVSVPSFNEYSKSQKLNDAASNLQSVLRQAQNNAQTGTTCNISGTAYKASSWVVTLNSDKYSVSPACDFSSVAGPTPTQPPSQQYPLPSGVIISDVKNTTTNCSWLDDPVIPLTAEISYKNLSSEVAFKLTGCTFSINAVVEITFCLTDSATCPDDAPTKTVRVEKGGGIYVKQ